jgi:N-acetylmuramoyl-L-alanine amidase
LAFATPANAPHLFLSYQPEGTTGDARRLNPEVFYVACRWDYQDPSTTKTRLLEEMALVRAGSKEFKAYPADWGPNANTGRVADLSPGLLEALGIQTDDTVEVVCPFTSRATQPTYQSIVISSGHGKYVRGASALPDGLDEVDETRRVVDAVAKKLRSRGVKVKTFHDDVSKTQNENLHCIVDYHNAQTRDMDVSVPFCHPASAGRSHRQCHCLCRLYQSRREKAHGFVFP